jgi:2-dehydro-3-deoxygluconokinase
VAARPGRPSSSARSSSASAAPAAARANGAIVSYDLNYRASLWQERGGIEAANELNHKLLEFADVVFGIENFNSDLSEYSKEKFGKAANEVFKKFPNLQIAATTLRHVESAASHSLSAVCATKKGEIFKALELENISVLDRVGSGDAFAAGFIYGLLNEKDFTTSLNYGTANSALTLTTPGDSSAATLAEIENLSGKGKINLFR